MPHSPVVIVDLRLEGGLLPGPLSPVCGLPVLVRTLLVLERRGYQAAVLLYRPEDREVLSDVLARHHRIGLELELVPAPHAGIAPAVAAARTICPEVPQVLWWPGALSFGRLAPELVDAVAPAGAALAGEGAPVGPAQVPAELLVSCQDADNPLEELKKRGSLRTAALDLDPVWVREQGDVKRATRALLDSLRKKEDGVVAQYDRNISLFVSRHLMKLPVHPHIVTVGAALLGIGCGIIAAQGGYLYLLLGALLFQANSIMDGIDGEIARAKLLESKAGQWLDTIADDSCNLFFTVGAAVGCYRTWDAPVYLVLAGVIGFGFVMTAILEYHYLITVARSGDLNQFKMPWEESPSGEAAAGPGEARPGVVARVLASLKWIVRRDTFVFLTTVFALIGQLWIMVWAFAVGASVVWVSILTFRVILPMFRGSGEQARRVAS